MGGTMPVAAGVMCGGCQQDVSAHALNCSEVLTGRSMFANYEGPKCDDCGRPDGRGHDADCNHLLNMFGFSVDD